LRALRNRKKKKKPCLFCSKKSVFAEKDIYWRNAELLSRFLFSNFQIVGRKFSGVCHRHQLLVNQEVKKAKNMALIKTIDY
jgi:ribosomal protein S18